MLEILLWVVGLYLAIAAIIVVGAAVALKVSDLPVDWLDLVWRSLGWPWPVLQWAWGRLRSC